MFKPKLYLPSNIRRSKPDNALITDSSVRNEAINLLDWFGINLLTGSSSLVLSQAGTWVNNGANGVIQITIAALQALISANTVQYPAIYEVTDFADGGGVFSSTSTSSIDRTGVGYWYIPDYTISGVGVYKGQLLSTSVVVATDRWIWGNQVWASTTGTNPAAIDEYTLDPAAWTLLAKSTANGYLLQEFIVEWDASLNVIGLIKQAAEQNEAITSPFAVAGGNLAINTQQWANSSITFEINKGGTSLNNRILSSSYIFSNTGSDLQTNLLINSSSINDNKEVVITGNSLDAGVISTNVGISGIISGNTINTSGSITNNQCSNSLIDNNQVINDSGNRLSYNIFYDAVLCQNNVLSGTGCIIEANFSKNNSEIDGNTLSGNTVVIGGNIQTRTDLINDNTLSGNDVFIQENFQQGQSSIQNNTIAGNSSYIKRNTQKNSEISSCTFNAVSGANKNLSDNTQTNNTITNVTDFSITNSEFVGSSLNFTGWTRDIDGLSLVDGKGSFAFTHDFGVAPLASGSSLYFGYFPMGAVAMRTTYIVSGLSGGAGASLRAGIETDDNDYAFAATDVTTLANTVVNAVSTITAAARSFQLTASVADITAGNIKVEVEFIY